MTHGFGPSTTSVSAYAMWMDLANFVQGMDIVVIVAGVLAAARWGCYGSMLARILLNQVAARWEWERELGDDGTGTYTGWRRLKNHLDIGLGEGTSGCRTPYPPGVSRGRDLFTRPRVESPHPTRLCSGPMELGQSRIPLYENGSLNCSMKDIPTEVLVLSSTPYHCL
jgi:hypothetical protein